MASVTEPQKTNRARKNRDSITNKESVRPEKLTDMEVAADTLDDGLESIVSPEFDHDHDHHHHHEHDEEHSFTNKVAILGAVVFPLLGMAAAIIMAWQFGMMNWLNLTMLIGGWYLTGLGITIGFHRMLTHRSFECKPAVRWFWTALGSLAVEGSPIDWCMVHRKHHQFSDHEGDPHSPHLHGEGWWNAIKGFWHSHTGWLFNKNWSRSERKKYVPDLMDDPVLQAIDGKYYWWVVATLMIPLFIGGFAALVTEVSIMSFFKGAGLGFIWGGLARVCLSHHMTWSINSICHIIGSQDYKSSDDSRNNLFFGILSHGEGWHNNHHAFPTSARHGLKWWQLDLSWMIIRGMEMCGLAWSVKLPSKRQLETKAND